MSVASVRAAMSDALAGIAGLRSVAYLSDAVNPPSGGGAAMIDVAGPNELVFGREGYQWTYTVKVFAPRVDDRSSQAFLDTLRDVELTTSVKQVLEGDSALGALVSYGQVGPCSPTQLVQIGAVEYLMVEWEVEVVTQ